MAYFSNLPMALYDFTINTDKSDVIYSVSDITTRVTKYTDVLTEEILLDDYYISEGETPEIICHKLYDDPELHWTILYINSIIDMADQWPMPDQVLSEQIKELYSEIVKSDNIRIPIRGRVLTLVDQENNENATYFYVDSDYYAESEHVNALVEIESKIKINDWLNIANNTNISDARLEEFSYHNGRLSRIKLSVVLSNYDNPLYDMHHITPQTPLWNTTKYWKSATTDIIGTPDSIESIKYLGGVGSTDVVSTGDTAVRYTHYDHEILMNEGKRKIKVISPNYISTFISQFNAALT